MLIIRLQRVGKRNEPTFRVVLTDSKNGPKSGKFLEVLGSYDPRDKNITKIDGDKVTEWISKGAQVTDTVHNILVNQGVIKADKINVLPKKAPIVAESSEEESSEAPAEESQEASVDTPAEATPEEAPAEDAPSEEPKEESAPAEESKEEEQPTEETTEEASAEEDQKEE
jgi:small subunit ribosomal protein S16